MLYTWEKKYDLVTLKLKIKRLFTLDLFFRQKPKLQLLRLQPKKLTWKITHSLMYIQTHILFIKYLKRCIL